MADNLDGVRTGIVDVNGILQPKSNPIPEEEGDGGDDDGDGGGDGDDDDDDIPEEVEEAFDFLLNGKQESTYLYLNAAYSKK